MICKLSLLISILIHLITYEQPVLATDTPDESNQKSFEEENYGVKYADDCEGKLLFDLVVCVLLYCLLNLDQFRYQFHLVTL